VQWSAGGIQLSSTPTSSYSHQIAINNSNSFWKVWRAEETGSPYNGLIYLKGIDQHGTPLTGFGAGAVLIADSGDYYLPQIMLSDYDNIIAPGTDTWIPALRSAIFIFKSFRQPVPHCGVAETR